jgi:hypothetical protein
MGRRGIAISSVLYLIMLIAGALLISTLGIVMVEKGVLKSKLESLFGDVNQNIVKQYRYITEGGEWSSWIDYNDLNEINHTLNLKRISNLGNRGRDYDLTTTNVTLNIIKGQAYLSFNGSSKADSGTSVLTVANTIVLEVVKNSDKPIISFDNNQVIKYASDKLNISDGTNSRITNNTYSNGTSVLRYVLTLDKQAGTYNVYCNENLVATTGTTNILRINTVYLGYQGSDFFNGKIYKIALSTMLLSPDEAKQLSKQGLEDHQIILNKSNTEIMYGPFIEYRKIPLSKKDTSSDTFSTRYIRDLHNGNTENSNNEIIEIEAYAHFALYNKFNDIMVGGTYTTTPTISGTTISLGAGTFIHPNGREFNLAQGTITTPFSVNDPGSGLILFNANINKFVYAEYGDKTQQGTNDWYYYDTTWHLLEPNSNNAIVGFVTKHADDTNLTEVNLFNNSFTFNIALGKSVIGSSGATGANKVVDGNRGNIYLNGTNSRYVTVDLGLEYNITEVKVYRQHDVNALRATKSVKTILYNNGQNKSKVLWDADEKGLYVESDKGASFYVDQTKKAKAFKSRYVEDCINGRYAVSDNSYSTINEWRELEVFDINGHYNLALNKPLITSSDTKTNLSNVNDGNKTTIFTASSGDVCVTVDLQQDYAIRSANILRSNQSYIDAKVKTLLLDVKQEYYYDLYNSEKEGLYRKDTQGIYLTVNNIDSDKTYAFDDTFNIIQGVNHPQLAPGMTPKKWSGSAWVTTTEYDNDWYRYDTTNKRWANAQTADGSMWVWIPRYAYQIASRYHTSTTGGGTINVKFLKGVTNATSDNTPVDIIPTYSGSSQTNYIEHPGFNFGGNKVSGLWVAKFEATAAEGVVSDNTTCNAADNTNSKTVKIIPGARSWRCINNKNAFEAVRAMETNPVYGWGTSGKNIDTHMMKNTEWGAVAYLSKSSYGKDTEITINDNTSYYTGGGPEDSYISNVGQSTTGTIYGIYDISGGTWEKTMANYNNTIASSGWTAAELSSIPSKYINRYYTALGDMLNGVGFAYDSSVVGDAVYETSNDARRYDGSNWIGSGTSWYSDGAYLPRASAPWFNRGGFYSRGANAGAFAFGYSGGGVLVTYGFRPLVVVGPGL